MKIRYKFKSQQGFIAIIAVGVLALLMFFGIIVQQTVMDTYTSVKSVNNYYAASDIAGSAVEYLQFQLNENEAGYNTGEINCRFEDGVLNSDDAASINGSVCSGLTSLVGSRDVEIIMEIKGRADDDSGGTTAEKLKTSECRTGAIGNINSNCYIVPFPGTGDSGDRCEMYDPVFDGDVGGSRFIDSQLAAGLTDLDQINYSCNWNKLSFGSSLTDRVAIPLYYDLGDGTIVNPFVDGDATQFVLRLRTPCKSCGVPNSSGDVPAWTRECEAGSDPTVCTDDERYVLNEEDGNEIVVQWHLSGECGGEECGLVARALDAEDEDNSALFESFINEPEELHNILLKNDAMGIITNLHPETTAQIWGEPVMSNRILETFEKPILTLFLNNALISDLGKNVPYLEYQILTNSPVGNPKSRIEVTVNVDGNVFKKTLSKEEQKPLIDFAVQN